MSSAWVTYVRHRVVHDQRPRSESADWPLLTGIGFCDYVDATPRYFTNQLYGYRDPS